MNKVFHKIQSKWLKQLPLMRPLSRNASKVVQEKIRVAKNVEINYGKIGNGPHVLLCLPGLFGSIESDFELAMTKFNPEKFTVLCMDFPGNGKSRPPEHESAKRQYAKDGKAALQLMKTLEIPKYSIAGWSAGGAAGISMINDHPKNIEKLVFWGPPAFIDEQIVQMTEFLTHPKNWVPARWKMMVNIYGEKEMGRMLTDFYDSVVDSHKLGGYRLEAMASNVNIPTLILHGKKDLSCPVDHPKALHKRIPNSILEFWPEGQHDLHLEFPDQFVQRVEEFILTSK